MPMYYFCLHDRDEVSDIEGTELPNLEAAREHAATVGRELTFKREGMLDRNWSRWVMSVRDNEGRELFFVTLSDWDQKKDIT
jgi:hypothetical protein